MDCNCSVVWPTGAIPLIKIPLTQEGNHSFDALGGGALSRHFRCKYTHSDSPQGMSRASRMLTQDVELSHFLCTSFQFNPVSLNGLSMFNLVCAQIFTPVSPPGPLLGGMGNWTQKTLTSFQGGGWRMSTPTVWMLFFCPKKRRVN